MASSGWLGELALALRRRTTTGSYQKDVHPEGQRKLRPLGIRPCGDRVCNDSSDAVLEPIFEADLHPNSTRTVRRNANGR